MKQWPGWPGRPRALGQGLAQGPGLRRWPQAQCSGPFKLSNFRMFQTFKLSNFGKVLKLSNFQTFKLWRRAQTFKLSTLGMVQTFKRENVHLSYLRRKQPFQQDRTGRSEGFARTTFSIPGACAKISSPRIRAALCQTLSAVAPRSIQETQTSSFH